MRPVTEFTFESFITGKTNAAAYAAAKAAAERPGENCDPLFLYGGSGLGKTHLLNAIRNRIRETAPDRSVIMLTADELTGEMVTAIRAGQTDAWRAKLCAADYLLIDDAHVLLGREATQAELLSLVRACVRKGCRVVITASAGPDLLSTLGSGLREASEKCLFAELRPLDAETCGQVARDRAARCGIRLSEEMLEYIVSHAGGEVRRLEGIICRLRAGSELMGLSLDMAAVKQACGEQDRAASHQSEARVKTVYIMIGIQGSGKSEFCRRCLPDVERINLDTLGTRKNEMRVIAACQARGIDYVIDNTNPTREDRARYIPAAKAAGYRVVGYFMQSRLRDCIARNELRKGKEKVPAKAIAMTSNRLQLPGRAEGFDELYFIENDGAGMRVSKWRENDEF